MFCKTCGKQIPDGSTQCPECQAAANPSPAPTPQFSSAPQPAPTGYTNPYARPADNRKTFCVMSHIGILWLFGMLSYPEKTDPRVRFNVGQGMLRSIIDAGLLIVILIVNTVIAALTRDSFTGRVPIGAVLIMWHFWLALAAFEIFYMVYGIVSVVKNDDKPLPIIGNWAFYR